MNEKIRRISNQIAELENELRAEIHAQESRLLYQIKGKRIEFEHSIRPACSASPCA
ncbi:hypothetical protein [Sulfuricella sp. T08]|uniref:hypothetical protein n=1 Tax=Sulfuricella sp. T08 TaxID=1632857 RepID=UPI00131F04A4|nr:hypothetical protein [Sulfuricella sp. T08]